jgi:hypothetical protein
MIVKGESFLTTKEAERIKSQGDFLKMYMSEYVWQAQYTNDRKKIDVDPLVPIPALISEINSDLIFGEKPRLVLPASMQGTLTDFFKERAWTGFDIMTDLLEASAYVSALGMCFINLWKDDDDEIYWNFYLPNQCLWAYDKHRNITEFSRFICTGHIEGTGNAKYDIQHYEMKEGKCYYEEYKIQVDINGKVVEKNEMVEVNTGLAFIPVIPVFNLRQTSASFGDDEVGKSDYEGKQQLFAELDNRIDQINNILQEHSDPWVALPAGVLDQNGQFRRSQGKMYEKAGAGVSSDSDNSVDFHTWDASMQAQFQHIEVILKMIFETSRISKPISGFDNSGTATDSGRALKWQSVSTIAMINRKRVYWDAAIKRMVYYLTQMQGSLSKVDAKQMEIEWPDGLPIDETEVIQNVVAQINAGILSRLTGIQQVQEVDPAAAQVELDQVTKEAGDKADIEARATAPVMV